MTKTFISSLFASLLSAASLFCTGCSPSLEEACAEYCTAIGEAGCEDASEKDCNAECATVIEKGECTDEYADVYDCAADLEFECVAGGVQPTSQDCVEEAFELLACAGFTTE